MFFKKNKTEKETLKQKQIEQAKQEKISELNRVSLFKQKMSEDYNTARRNYGYTHRHNKIVSFNSGKYYMFVSDNYLRLFICQPPNWETKNYQIPKWDKRSIPLSDILYFSREGEVYTETKITGGGGGGSSLGGAIVGGVIAGVPGAIIASRSKNDPIKSETITHDTRKTLLVCKNKKLVFSPEDYTALMQLIPDKELSVVQQKRAAEASQQTIGSPSDRLKKLKALLDEELITQAEYEAKRKEILREI